MNKQMKQHLETVVNSIVNEDTDAATSAFHEYLRMKTQSILLGENDEEECDEDEDKEGKDKKDDDKEDKDGKKDDDKEDKKSKKANPFAKKDDKDEEKDEEDEK